MTQIMSDAGPEMIPLSGGLPNPAMFPFRDITLTVSDNSKIEISGDQMKAALQYLPTNGQPELVKWLMQFQNTVHKPPSKTFDNSGILTTVGSQDGLSKAMEMMMTEGGSVVIQDYVYPGSLAAMTPYNPNYIVVESDKSGMKPDKLHEALKSRWSALEALESETAPKFMYINPTGANPTGANLTQERKRQIYQICSEYDLIILEDDPYYFLHYEDGNLPSFYSLDTEGRVMRFDSFSKILSSGIRLGFLTGPKPLTERVALHMQASVMHASSLSQVITNELLKKWGNDGLFEHIKNVQDFYKRRRDCMIKSADKHLKDLCEWSVPQGGMFLWINVNDVPNTWDMIMKRAMKKNVMLIPGRAFMPNDTGSSSFMRASFSIASEERIDVGMQRLADLIKEEVKRN